MMLFWYFLGHLFPEISCSKSCSKEINNWIFNPKVRVVQDIEKPTCEPLFNFDISKSKSVIRARRHFVRLILSYIDTVSYVPRGKATDYDKKNNDTKNEPAA